MTEAKTWYAPFWPGRPKPAPEVGKRHILVELTGREYLPMAAAITLWAVVVAAIGHADAARLLAAVAMVRAAQMLTKLATPISLKRRADAPAEIRQQAFRFAFKLQAGALIVALVLVALLAVAMRSIRQEEIAAFIPYLAIGMPARYLRFTDVRTASPYYRLALAGGGLVMVLFGWAAGWGAAGLGLAFGAREWVAYFVMRWWPRTPRPAKLELTTPLEFPEVARNSAILGRRMLTYRLSKSLLTLMGPLGSAAARTGRGLNWHKRVEPYVPHHFGGFALFSLGTFGAGVILALRSGEPAAMVGAGGLFQIGAAAANVVLLWHYLPTRDAEPLPEDDDDDD